MLTKHWQLKSFRSSAARNGSFYEQGQHGRHEQISIQRTNLVDSRKVCVSLIRAGFYQGDASICVVLSSALESNFLWNENLHSRVNERKNLENVFNTFEQSVPFEHGSELLEAFEEEELHCKQGIIHLQSLHSRSKMDGDRGSVCLTLHKEVHDFTSRQSIFT